MSERKVGKGENMKNFKLLFLSIFIGITAIIPLSAQTNRNGFKIISENSQSNVDKPFVFVARDARTYLQLKNLVKDLPAAETIDFKNYAVVAAFAGQKNTGGYNIVFNKTRHGVLINLESPPKGSMVIQMLTQPYKVALIPAEEEKFLPLNLSANWARISQNYRITKSGFRYSGGFAGIKKSFNAAGNIIAWNFGNYVTVYFNLRGTRRDAKLRLTDYASGTMSGGKINLTNVDAGTFVQLPRPPFEVSGTRQGRTISLHFKSLETKYRDGFTGEGNLTAVEIR